MALLPRVIPVASKEKLQNFIDDIRNYPNKEERDDFVNTFGGAWESWYYQELDGKPHIIAITEGNNFDAGFAQYATSEQPFFVWFRQQILELTGLDMRQNPGGATSEHIFTFGPDL